MNVRLVAAAAVLVSGAVHLQMWFDGVRDQSVGPAFMVNSIAGPVIAVLLLTWRHWFPLLMAVGFGASTLGAFIIAATAGLYGVHTHWEGVRVWMAAASEVVAILAGLFAAWREGYLSRDQLQHGFSGRRSDLH